MRNNRNSKRITCRRNFKLSSFYCNFRNKIKICNNKNLIAIVFIFSDFKELSVHLLHFISLHIRKVRRLDFVNTLNCRVCNIDLMISFLSLFQAPHFL